MIIVIYYHYQNLFTMIIINKKFTTVYPPWFSSVIKQTGLSDCLACPLPLRLAHQQGNVIKRTGGSTIENWDMMIYPLVN